MLEECLEQNHLTQTAFAHHLKMTQAKINEICRGKRGITPDVAMKLGKAFGQNPMFWMNMQKSWEMSQLDEADYDDIEPIKRRA